MCSSCGAQNRAGAKFCSECGSPLALACPSCGTPIVETDRFCSECGLALQKTPTDSSTNQERRFVSVLFIDLVGFTPLTERRDSEEVRSMLTRYFDRAREIVHRFGGVIDKFIGDAVMAVWGAGVAHEDDAERAVRAALELVDAVEVLGQEVGLPDLRARAGVLSGEAAVGGDGNEGTGLIIGDIVNTASRLQTVAEPGTVLVGESTVHLAERAIEFTAAGSKELKGKSASVEAWLAVRVVAGRRGDRRTDQLTPPFVGRAGELRLLKDQVHAVGAEGRSRLVSIVGQGGIGKTRLADELRNYLDGISETIYWHQGRSPAYGEGLTFWALGEMVRSRSGIAEADDPHRARTKLRTAIAEHVGDADDRAWIEPRLAGLLGLADVPPGDRSELFAAWRTFFLRIADRGTTVMVFEDLQWADDGVLEFIEEFVSIGSAQPILVITLARPQLLERRPGWGSGRSNSIGLYLSPLSDAAMRDLVLGVVPDAEGSLVGRLVEKAGGVPLYAVELVRMLVTRGLLVAAESGKYTTCGDIDELDVPDSLSGLVGARLDRLDAKQRELLQDAAILGQSFTLEGLAILGSEEPGALSDLLEPLVREEILDVNRDPRSPERGQYHFVQSIIREVAYQRISKAVRRDRHLRVAEYFESLDEPELAAAAASHYLDALEVAEATDGLRERAIEALLTAAGRAAALQSHAQVVALCMRGIDVAGDGPLAGELWLKAASSAHAGLDERAEEFAEHAIEAFVNDPVGRIRATTMLARLYNDTGRGHLSAPRLQAAIEAAPGTSRVHGKAIAELARSLMLNLQEEGVLEWCDQALTIAEDLDDIPVITEALITKGVSLGGRYRRPREGVALLEAGLALAKQHGLTYARRRAVNNLAYLTSSETPFDTRYLAEQLEEARRIGEPRYLSEMTIAYAFVHQVDLRWDDVDAMLAEIRTEDLPVDLRDDYNEMSWRRKLLTGDAAAAEVALKEIFRRRGEEGDAQVKQEEAVGRASIAFAMGRYQEAFDLVIDLNHQAPGRPDLWWALMSALQLRDADALQQVVDRIEDHRFKGRAITLLKDAGQAGVAALDGRHDEAVELFERVHGEVIELMPKLFSTMMLAGAAGLLGMDDPVGRRLAREAYDVYSESGVTTLLETLSHCLLPPEEQASTA